MFLSMGTVSPGIVTISCIGKYENDLLLGHLKLGGEALRSEAFDSSPPLELAYLYPKAILISLVWSRIGGQYL